MTSQTCNRGDRLLDVGAGDGLVAFGALERLSPDGRVILSDISVPLLERARQIATDMGALDRCSFVESPAETLAGIDDLSVNVVTTRSVLIYVAEKRAAFESFFRVLTPGGRLSIFEPINRLTEVFSPGCWWGAGIPGVEDLAGRLGEFYRALPPPDTDPMLNFDERGLFSLALEAGFDDVRMQLDARMQKAEPIAWNTLLATAGNPLIPTLGGAIQQLFTTEETARFEAHVRPVVESGGRRIFLASVFLQGVKPAAAR